MHLIVCPTSEAPVYEECEVQPPNTISGDVADWLVYIEQAYDNPHECKGLCLPYICGLSLISHSRFFADQVSAADPACV